MTFKEYIEEKYGDTENCYPFDGNDKHVFMFVMDEIEGELEDRVVKLEGVTPAHPSDVFKKLMQNDHIEVFSYYADGDNHHIKALIKDEDTVTALKLIDDPQKCFDMMFKD